MAKALFVGSFDPIHLGHVSIIKRASLLFDSVIVGVAADTKKNALPAEKRLQLIKLSVEGFDNVEIVLYEGLTVDLYKKIGADVLVRGVRNVLDFEYEKSLAAINKVLSKDVETCLFLCDRDYEISSSLIKELAKLNADLSKFVPHKILDLIKELYS